MLSGLAAAEGALADLGFGVDAEYGAGGPTPELDCFVDRGGGLYGRIQVRYPSGPPPAGGPEVEIDPSEPAETGGFDAALRRWRDVCSERAHHSPDPPPGSVTARAGAAGPGSAPGGSQEVEAAWRRPLGGSPPRTAGDEPTRPAPTAGSVEPPPRVRRRP